MQLSFDHTTSVFRLVFYPANQSATLASKLHVLLQLAADGVSDSAPPEVRRAAVQLEIALDRFAELIAENVLGDESRGMARNRIFRALRPDGIRVMIGSVLRNVADNDHMQTNNRPAVRTHSR